MVVLSFAILLLRAATALHHKSRVLTSRDLMGMGESKDILPSPQGDKALFRWSKYFNTTNFQENSQQLINHKTGHRVNLTALYYNGERNNYQWIDNNAIGFLVQKGDHFQFWELSETQSSQYEAKQLVNVSIESVVNVKYNSNSKILYLATSMPVNKKDVATFDSASICIEAPFENSGIPKITRLYGVRLKGDGVIATKFTNFSDYINLEPKQKLKRFENSQDGTLMSLVIVKPINYFQNNYFLKVFDVNQLKIIDSFELGDNDVYTHTISPNNQIVVYIQDTDSLIDQSFRLVKLYDLNMKSSTVINQDWGNLFSKDCF